VPSSGVRSVGQRQKDALGGLSGGLDRAERHDDCAGIVVRVLAFGIEPISGMSGFPDRVSSMPGRNALGTSDSRTPELARSTIPRPNRTNGAGTTRASWGATLLEAFILSRALSLVAVAAFALGSVACSTTRSLSFAPRDATPVHPLIGCSGGAAATPEQAAAFYGCERIDGDLRVQSADLLDLGAFSELREVTGSLVVQSNPKLRSLQGLERLSSVGALTIARNPRLESVASLEALTFVGSVTISGNPRLRGLSGLGGLRWLERLELRDNGLYKTTGLDGLERIGTLVIQKHERLISLAGFGNLQRVRSLDVSDNPRVCAQFGLFPRLAEVEGEMSLTRNFGLSSADLEALRARVRLGREAAELTVAAAP
jgi:hypothetical protein